MIETNQPRWSGTPPTWVTKFQQAFAELTPDEQTRFRAWMDDLLADLLGKRVRLAEVVYAPIQMVEDVKQFVRYNANKAMNNMGCRHL